MTATLSWVEPRELLQDGHCLPVERCGLGKAALSFIYLGERIQRAPVVSIRRANCIADDHNGPLHEWLGLCVPPLLLIEPREIVQRTPDVGRFCRNGPFVDGKCALEQGFRFIEATLLLTDLGQPIQIVSDVAVVGPSLAFVNFKSTPHQRLGKVQSTFGMVQPRLDTDCIRVCKVILSDSVLNQLHILLGQWHGLVVTTGTVEFNDAPIERCSVFLTREIPRRQGRGHDVHRGWGRHRHRGR